MKPITKADIPGCDAYERARPELRRSIMVVKGKRRVPLGDHATVHFESRDTMLYQVHEMLRAEGSWERPGAVEDEFEAYNPIVPAGRALSATLMLEYETPEERAVRLAELVGLDRHLSLHVGATVPAAAVFDRTQVSPTRISSVQYVRFPLTAERVAIVRVGGRCFGSSRTTPRTARRRCSPRRRGAGSPETSTRAFRRTPGRSSRSSRSTRSSRAYRSSRPERGRPVPRYRRRSAGALGEKRGCPRGHGGRLGARSGEPGCRAVVRLPLPA